MMNKSRTVQFIVLMFFVIGTTLVAAQTVSMQYENGFLSADIQSVTLREIFEELKKQTGINYEIEKEIQEQKVTISFKEKELTQAIKDILNAIGNPSYMISYKDVGAGSKPAQTPIRNDGLESSPVSNGVNVGAIGQSPKYVVSGITIRKRGSSDTTAQTAKRELQPGEMEVGQVTDDPKWNAEFKNLKKYRIRAKNASVNELLQRLSDISGKKIVAVKIDKIIDFEDEDDEGILLRHIIEKLRPKIYKTGRQMSEVDRKGNVIKEGYYEVIQLSDAEIKKRREESEEANKKGEELMKEGRCREAEEAFSKAIDPDYIAPTINEGKIYLINRAYDMAIGQFNCALAVDSTSADAYLGLIEAYEKTGQMDKVVESMGKYISLSKDEKKIEDIKKKLESLNDKVIKDYYSFIKKGDEYRGKHDIDKAKVEYEDAIKIKPDLIFAYLKMAELYENAKDFSKAEGMYKKAIEVDKLNFELYIKLASMDMNIGKVQESIKLMKKAIEVCPVKDTVDRINEMIKRLEHGR